MIEKASGVLVAATILIAGCASQESADEQGDQIAATAPRRYVCRHTDEPIVIDGRLIDAAWADTPWTDPFVDIQGEGMPEPRFETRARMLWDDEFLYIAARLEEPHVWATLTEHDQIVFNDNDFEIFIDPDGDREQYYEIEVNALNTIFDLFMVKTYIDGGPALHDWDLKGMKHAVHVDGTLNDPTDLDRRWTVEFALPWEQLKPAANMPTPPNEGDVWRINFSRVEWKHDIVEGAYARIPDTPEDNWVWSPQGVINMHVPEHWGYLEFTKRTRAAEEAAEPEAP